MRLKKWVGIISPGEDDDSPMDCGSRPVAMGMPPQGSFLFGNYDLISKFGSWLNWALCNVFWAIRPWIPWLLHSMPALLLVKLNNSYTYNVLKALQYDDT